MHDRDTAEGEQQLHTHVVLPGTTETLSGPEPFYNNKKEGHVALFNEIADKQFELALDKTIGLDWRALRPEPELEHASGPTSSAIESELEKWFGPRQPGPALEDGSDLDFSR